MIIDVDIGNTRIKWRYAQPGASIQFIDAPNAVPDEWLNLPSGSRMRLSSVVGPEKTTSFVALIKARCGIDAEIAVVKSPFAGVNVAYAEPLRLGVDRWLALLAGHHFSPGRDLVVVHGGTALVVDFLSSDGRHVGGFIAPGVRTALSGLLSSADAIRLADSTVMRRDQPGTTTLECIHAGFSALYGGFLQQIAKSASANLDRPRWIFAGGDGEFLVGLGFELWKEESPLVVPGLVMDGLAIALP